MAFTGQSQSVGSSTSVSLQSRPLLMPDEVCRLEAQVALILTQGTPPIFAAKIGTPPATRTQRTLAAVLTHPGRCGALAAACFFVWALSPLMSLQFATTPSVQVAGVDPTTVIVPTMSASVVPIGISPAPIAFTNPAPATPSPPPPKLWQLWYSELNPGLNNAIITEQGRYENQVLCEQNLDARYGTKARSLEQKPWYGMRDVKVSQIGNKLRWEYVEARGKFVNESWCEKRVEAKE